MNIFTQYKYRLLVTTLSFFILSACGGGSTPEEVSVPMGSLVLAITDAPVDEASNVVVKFTGVEIKPASGTSITVIFSEPMEIDLLALQGGGSELLLNGLQVEVGEYNWMRLLVEAEKNTFDSYLQIDADDDGSRTSLWIPSGQQTGLKLNHSFVISAGGNTDLTIDFDLRKSITNPVGQENDYILKPSLRIVDNNAVGEIAGTVAEGLLVNVDSTGVNSCSASSAVYVFAADVSGEAPADAEPDDIDGDDTDGADPITTAIVEMAQDGTYQYSVAFLSEGFYTIAFTCNAGDDVADEDNTDVEFLGTITVEVVAESTTEHNFIAE
ncbi:MAG: hypothetical protein ACI9IA_002166 [Enterobacterales bacterium]|jgi:hypothetical protein